MGEGEGGGGRAGLSEFFTKNLNTKIIIIKKIVVFSGGGRGD